jgi:predicted TIM-barrel fold metal-dependent hydrolase
MIIDSHIHLFPDAMCPQTIEKLAVADPQHHIAFYNDGSVSGAEEKMARWGIDLGIMLPIATNLRQQDNVNAFARKVQEEHPAFIALGSVHPDDPNFKETLGGIAAAGLHGVKFHPDYQAFDLLDSRMKPIYDEMVLLGLPAVIHTGYSPASPDHTYAQAEDIRRLAEENPALTIVSAHTGGLSFGSCPRDYFAGLDNLYFDTAVASITFTPEEYRRIIDVYGAERFLFATDNPWGDGTKDLAFFEAVGLTPQEKQKIYEDNARRIFHIAL